MDQAKRAELGPIGLCTPMCFHWLSLGLTAWLRDSHILRQLPSANSGNSIASGATLEIQEVSESVELGLLA